MRREYTSTKVLEERYADGALSARLPALRARPQTQEHIDTVAFNFMKALASDLHGDTLCLPSLPEVAIKIRHALASEHSDLDSIRRVVGADPVLAARVMAAANSALGGSTSLISDLHTAILRLGLKVVYSFAMSVALQQVLHAQVPDALRSRLKAEWEHTIRVSVIAQALARTATALNADEAFLAGLFHAVGKLFILKKTKDYPELIGNPEALQLVMTAWHHEVGFALAIHWGLAIEVADAIRGYEIYDLGAAGPPTLTAVICVANRAAIALEQTGDGPPAFPSCRSLDVPDAKWRSILGEVQDELQHLHHMLGA